MDDGHGPEAGELERARREIDAINGRLLDILSERARLVREVRTLKDRLGIPYHSAVREREMLERLVAANPGPYPDDVVRRIFLEIFRASLDYMSDDESAGMRIGRTRGLPDVTVVAAGHAIGPSPVVVAGPCSVEGPEQIEAMAAALSARGVHFLRGGAFKPRTSRHAFQGLGEEGLRLLSEAARRHGMASVSEVLDPRHVALAASHVDVLQVGSRNMANYALLKELASAGRPVLLKRGFAASVNEFLEAADYLAAAGADQIVLCERGIRTFERETRFTLDISAVPLLRRACRLPIVVDVSHAAGRTDIQADLAAAALAAGAHGVMVEVHPEPALALSDAHQQLDLAGFDGLLARVRPWIGGA